MVLYVSYSAKVVNKETAFLYKDLEEEIYMECPLGMSNIENNDWIILKKCIHGLIQAASQYCEKAIKILKN